VQVNEKPATSASLQLRSGRLGLPAIPHECPSGQL